MTPRLLDLIETIMNTPKLVAAPPSEACAAFFRETVEPVLVAQALSSLRKSGEYYPQLVGFFDGSDGGDTMQAIDVVKATGGEFGSARSKNAVAAVHRASLMLPYVKASVFVCEMYTKEEKALPDETAEQVRERFGKTDLHNDPEAGEGLMINMLYKEDGKRMQYVAIYPIIKVFNASTPKDTTLGPVKIMSDELYSKKGGRFVDGDE